SANDLCFLLSREECVGWLAGDGACGRFNVIPPVGDGQVFLKKVHPLKEASVLLVPATHEPVVHRLALTGVTLHAVAAAVREVEGVVVPALLVDDGEDDELRLLALASPLLPIEVIPPEPRLPERLTHLLPLGVRDEA